MSEELSMVYFKAKKLRCGLYDVYSSQAKEKCLTGLHLEASSTECCWKAWGMGCSALHTHLLKWFAIQWWCDSSCYRSYSVQVTVSDIW